MLGKTFRRSDRCKLCSSLILSLGMCWSFGGATQSASAQVIPASPSQTELSAGLPWDSRRQYYEQIPTRPIFDEDNAPLDRFLRQVINESSIQIDYMLWNLDQSNQDIIGETVITTFNPTLTRTDTATIRRPDFGYLALDRLSGQQPLTLDNEGRLGYAPTLGGVDLNSLNGTRLKYALQTTTGQFEASTSWIFQTTRGYTFHDTVQSFPPSTDFVGTVPVFNADLSLNSTVSVISPTSTITTTTTRPHINRRNFITSSTGVFNAVGYQAVDGQNFSPIVDLTGVTAIPLLRDGAATNRALIFDSGYAIEYDINVFNTEVNYIWDDQRPINGFHFRWLLGLRYMNLDETMLQIGRDLESFSDDNGNQAFVMRTGTISSDTQNQMLGPQLGARIEFVDDRSTLGVQPTLALTSNHIDARVSTNALFAGDNPFTGTTANPIVEATAPTTDKISQDKLAPIAGLEAYLKIRLFENMQLFASYNLMYLDSIVRPGDVIVYEDDGDSTPDFFAAPIETNMLIQGLNVGTIIEF